MKRNDLKPCPFCGGKPGTDEDMTLNHKFVAFVYCNCGATIYMDERKDTQQEAADAAAALWNRRVADG